MKKIIAILLLTVLMIPTVAVYAEDWEQDITVTYNGELIPFNVEPQIINDRTMVPFRAIFEKIGGTVSFDGATRTVSSEKDGKTVSFVIGEYEATVRSEAGEEKISIDTAPVIVNDYTLVPVRFVAEASGMKVNWDDFYREVVIIDTSAWKKELEEKSAFLDMIVNMPLLSESKVPVEAREEAGIAFSLGLRNMGEIYGVSGEGPENINLSFNLKVVSDEYFDGTNTKTDSNVVIDLSSLNSFLKDALGDSFTEEDKQMLDVVFKKHDLNIEIIVDDNYNIYINAKDIAEIVKSFGGEDMIELIDADYLKIPFPVEKMAEITGAENLWEMIDRAVRADETLTSETVKSIDMLFGMYADLCSDEYVKFEEKADGSIKIIFNITNEAYMAAIDNLIAEVWQYENIDTLSEEEMAYVEAEMNEMREIFSAMDYSVTGTVEVKDAVTQKADIKGYLKVDNFLIPDTENVRLDLNLEVTAKSNLRKSNETDKIKIPENFADITE